MAFYQLFHLIWHEIDRFGCFILKSGFFSKSLVLCLNWLSVLFFLHSTGDDPLSLHFNPPPFEDGTRLNLPLAVMASNRPSYLLRMLLNLRNVEGLDPRLVTVFIDGFFDEPSSVAKLFELNVEQHSSAGRLNSRISQVYIITFT